METDIISYTGVIASGMAIFLLQKFWAMSNKIASMEAKQDNLVELKTEVKQIHIAISDLKICVEKLRK